MNAIYPLPENPSAADIIRRSIVAHPSLFRESLIKQAEMHDDYSRVTRDYKAAQSAENQRNICLNLYDIIGNDDLSADDAAAQICEKCGPMVIALNVAAKLQCLPAHMRTQAAVKWDEEHAK